MSRKIDRWFDLFDDVVEAVTIFGRENGDIADILHGHTGTQKKLSHQSNVTVVHLLPPVTTEPAIDVLFQTQLFAGRTFHSTCS